MEEGRGAGLVVGKTGEMRVKEGYQFEAIRTRMEGGGLARTG